MFTKRTPLFFLLLVLGLASAADVQSGYIRFEQQVVDTAKAGRYVFVTGRNDFNKTLTRRVHREYLQAGLEDSDLVIVPNMGHELPNKNRLLEVLEYLDNSLH